MEAMAKDSNNIFQKLKFSIFNRKPFKYGIFELINYKVKAILKICKLSRKRMRTIKKQLLYQDGVSKLQQEFDMIKMIKQMKKVKLLTNILLSQQQKSLLPYFKQNLLAFNDNAKQKQAAQSKFKETLIKDKIDNRIIENNLKQAVKRANKYKTDQRIINSLSNFDFNFDNKNENCKSSKSIKQNKSQQQQKSLSKFSAVYYDEFDKKKYAATSDLSQLDISQKSPIIPTKKLKKILKKPKKNDKEILNFQDIENSQRTPLAQGDQSQTMRVNQSSRNTQRDQVEYQKQNTKRSNLPKIKFLPVNFQE
eukprot:403352870